MLATRTSFNLNSGKEAYQQSGFLILENFIEPMLCDLLMQRANDLITAFNPDEIKIAFNTNDNQHSATSYFLESGDKIRFFYEPKAIDNQGNLLKEKHLSINKIGHALHDLDPVFYCFSRLHKIANLTAELGIENPLLVQSMYICKQPFIGDEVVCHQDSTFIYVENQPVIGLWFALEDATIENGCLWAIPGEHRVPVKSRMICENNIIRMETYDTTPWPNEKLIPLEVKRGTLIVLHGLLPHMSKMNLSNRSRHAYTLHIISGNHHYPRDNWLQRAKTFPFKGF